MSKFKDFSANVPAPYNYRVTIDFWVWIHNTKMMVDPYTNLRVSSIVLKDFVTIAWNQGSTNTNVDIFCIPLESAYGIGTTTTKTAFQIIVAGTPQYLTTTINSASSTWTFVRCAYSYAHKAMYLNSVTGTLTPFTFIGGGGTFPTFLKKFYRVGDQTPLNFQGFSGLQTEIYIRNFNVYSEYLPQTMNLRFFNLHGLTSMLFFPQLLFSLPLDDLSMDGITLTGTTSLYDYSYQTATVLSKTSITLTFISNSLKPPKNFKRIKFLAPNKKYTNVDLSTTATLTLSALQYYNFDDSKAYSCNTGFIDISAFTCAASCPTGYTRLPQVKYYRSSELCNYQCPTGATCPSTSATIGNINANFACPATQYTLFYQCVTKATVPAKCKN